jgi:hypothetical protein
MIVIGTLFACITIMSISIQQADALQQIADPIVINVNPGGIKSFSWGLLAGDNETSILKLYAYGNGSEFVSLPERYVLTPGRINYILGYVTIPPDYSTNITLNPIIYSTIAENDKLSSEANATSIKTSKMLTITIGANKSQIVRNLINAPTVQKSSLYGLISKGTINSVISTPTTSWISSGNWTLNIENGAISSFESEMIWNSINGTNAHSHQFQNLKVSKLVLVNESSSNVSIKGLMDIGTNNRIVWRDVPTTININGKQTISISVDDKVTNHHFSSQPILGMVTSFIICSDIPGPNMEVLPFCSSALSIPEGNSNLNAITPPNNQSSELSQSTFMPKKTSDLTSRDQSIQRCESVNIVNASASGFEEDPNDYNPPAEAVDRDLKTWWANKGVPSWLEIELEKPTPICSIEISWNKGDERTYEFTVAGSSDNNIITQVFKGKSTGNTDSYEKYDIMSPTKDIKNIKFSFTDSSSKSGWVSIKEIKVNGG